MKFCILGDGLTGLALAKALVNLGINVDVFKGSKVNNSDKSRTIGISKNNIEFFNKNILDIEKFLWEIKKIEIDNENFLKENLINFEDNNQRLFALIKNYQLYKNLLSSLKKNKLFKLKKEIKDYNLFKNNYKLIFNCNPYNSTTKKFFNKKLKKNYNSYAHTAIIEHKKILKNHIARQIFTKKGPIAFLPISERQTSIVFSARGEKNIKFEEFINKYNNKYEIIKLNNIKNFELKSSHLRSYYHQNILAFGDLLHKIHPLAGQGFNMSIRDIKLILQLVKFRIDHGLDLDNSIFSDFEKRSKHKNYIFSNGIDFIYEFFKLASKTKSDILDQSVKFIGQNKKINKLIIDFADNGILI
mgnify:CR=1 FL=1